MVCFLFELRNPKNYVLFTLSCFYYIRKTKKRKVNPEESSSTEEAISMDDSLEKIVTWKTKNIAGLVQHENISYGNLKTIQFQKIETNAYWGLCCLDTKTCATPMT